LEQTGKQRAIDFFGDQKKARRISLLFLVCFVLAVALVLLLISGAIWLIASWLGGGKTLFVFYYLMFIVLAAMTGGCILRYVELRQSGGESVIRHLGGEPLPKWTADDLDEGMMFRRYTNIVEEMSIVSRVPMPSLFWLPNESSINALVAGLTQADAAMAVTRGALERLNRDELQGVIAHEFSHLLNGDMRLNTRTSSLLFGLHSVYVYGNTLLNFAYRPLGEYQHEDSPGCILSPLLIFFGLILTAFGYIGRLTSRILQASILRQREYLADASAVQFTRNARGLAGALKKIYYDSALFQSSEAEVYAYFFFSDAINLSHLLATHPPLIERILALDSNFTPEYGAPADTMLDVDELHRSLPLSLVSGEVVVTSERFSMREGVALVFSYFLDERNQSIFRQQCKLIEDAWEYDIAMQAKIMARKNSYDAMYVRLMRLRILLVRLHELSGAQKERMRKTIIDLIAANREISLLELAVAYLVQQYLMDMGKPGKTKIEEHVVYEHCHDEIDLLKKLLNENLNTEPVSIVLDDLSLPQDKRNAEVLSEALEHLNRLSMDNKERLFRELADSIDAVYLNDDQQEILSLLAVCLHAPPPDAMIDYPGKEFSLLPA